MQRVIIVGCLIFLCSLLRGAETTIIRSIHIRGNRAVSERQLLDQMVLKPASQLSFPQLHRDIEAILRLYNQNGYYFTDVHADSLIFDDDSSSAELWFGIEEGEQTAIGFIEFEGNAAFSKDEILQQFDTRIGNFLDQQILEHDLLTLVSRYERIGYPFASVEIKSIVPYREGEITKLRITLSVDEGSKVQINEIRISGNKETKDNVILRETRIKLGETYDQERVNQIQRRLNRLNIFSSVNAPELYVNSVGGGLLISVQEGNTNTFDGIIGYVPAASQGDQGIFTGLVNVTMRNLFGTARKLNVHWQRDDRRSQEVLLQYVEPWIFDFPLNLNGSFYQRQQDTTYVQRSVETEAELLVMESFSIGGLFTHESIIPSSTTAGQTVLNSRTITTGVEIRYDTRDDIYNPTSGVNYRSDYRIGKKKIFGLSQQDLQAKENSTVQKISLDAEFFVEPFRRQVFAVGLHGRQLTNDQIELGDLYRFGGAKTLRGFRENQFLGSRIAWTNTEYRFLLARRTFFFGFFDTGYYFLPGDDVKGISSTQHLKYGYGIGVRLETSLGNLGVSFALGEGDTFAQGKIHFGLVNEF